MHIYIYMSSSQYLDAYYRVIGPGSIVLVTLDGWAYCVALVTLRGWLIGYVVG